MDGDADLASVGAVLAEPARARVLLALADGRSLCASVLAAEAGVAASTASHHLSVLVEAGLISVVPRGRHRYFTLAGPQVGELVEAVARVAPALPVTSLRQGTRAHAVRYARSCYDHLAGRLGVALADALRERGVLGPGFAVTDAGVPVLADLGIEERDARGCLDWTEQREHLAGPLGRALLARLLDLGWLTRDAGTRAVRLTDAGRAQLPARLGVVLPPDEACRYESGTPGRSESASASRRIGADAGSRSRTSASAGRQGSSPQLPPPHIGQRSGSVRRDAP